MPEVSEVEYRYLQDCERQLHSLKERLEREQRLLNEMFTIRRGEALFETKDGLVAKAMVNVGGSRRFPDRFIRRIPMRYNEIRSYGDEFSQAPVDCRNYRLEKFFGDHQVPLYIET